MPFLSRNIPSLLKHPWQFIRQVIKDFHANQGILLAGAVAYYTLLSIIPLFTLALVVSTHLFSTEQLMVTLKSNFDLVVPGLTESLLEQVRKFIEYREVIGWAGILMMLFFSSVAFTVVENAMSVIFYHRVNIKRRHFLISAVLPYIFVLVLGIGLLLITVIAVIFQSFDHSTIELYFWSVKTEGITHAILYLLGVSGLIFLLTSIYMVMPIGGLSMRHALIGGIAAAVLWEIARHLLIWYFSTLSLVNVVYGSLATAVVSLLTLEVAALILLFGAQVIATYERLGEGQSESSETFQTL